MKAVKGNKVYDVNETTQKSYQEAGFDILDDDGQVISYGRGKTVHFDEYMALKKEKEQLQLENRELREQLASLERMQADSGRRKPRRESGRKQRRQVSNGLRTICFSRLLQNCL